MTVDISIDAQIERAIVALDSGKTFEIFFRNPDDSNSTEQLGQIDRLCQRHGVRLRVRFYGYYRSVFDAKVLSHIASVQNLMINSLESITNEDHIATLGQLKHFWFEVQTFNRADFLSKFDLSHLERLHLMAAAKSNLDLGPLASARHLRELVVDRHKKNIEVLAELPFLEHLTLWSQPKTVSLKFVAKMLSLRSLEIIMGGRETLSDLSCDTLEYLKLWHVFGLQDIGPLCRFKQLRGVAVQEQSRLTSVDISGASLSTLSFYDCKALHHLMGLDEQTKLEAFSAVQTQLPMDALRDRIWPASLRVLNLWSKSKAWNDATRSQLSAKGYQQSGGPWYTSALETFG